ncbi:VOC family protein [Nocardiopsis sp. CA-288880]|uniref:VOC family protein n=1 Tax=Nocardiopsis sp. CA-288880 TaxID=3239995 RepID=UPI003D968CE2
MTLSPDIITVGVPDVAAARAFYASAFATTADNDRDTALDLHGSGRLALQQIDELAAACGAEPATSGFRGCVLSSIVQRPAEVRALLAAATAGGATVVKPARKEFFGEFAAVHRAPDGALWKLAAASKKDTGPVPAVPRPIETAVFLGVARPKASKVFYEALGMAADHDYGDKFVDFAVSAGACRLGLLPRRALAGDAGVDGQGEGFSALALTHTAGSREEVDTLLAEADSAGGRVTAPAVPTDGGGYVGRFTDPDGHHWRVTARV